LEGEQDVELKLNVTDPLLWWPVGYGKPQLYDLQLDLEAAGERSELRRRLGLRTVELVTDPRPNGNSFFFRVNGVDVFAKGSNFIPADAFQPRAEQDLDWILRSAVEANMNMVRVWGGGMYQVDAFYELADELGLMIWQEMMFGCALYPRHPAFLDSVRVELQQQVLRLQHHASIVIWGGNNENEAALDWYAASRANRDAYVLDYNALYIETARDALLDLDPDVAFIDSSPSNGLLVEAPYTKRWGDVQSPDFGDVHYYNYDADCEDHTTYPRARFVSEHGYQSFPSFLEYEPVLSEEDWSRNSTQLAFRQRHPGGQAEMLAQVGSHFLLPAEFADERLTQEQRRVAQRKVFDDFLYLTQVQQSKCYETSFAQWRRLRSVAEVNTMGVLYWQLNDVWQGPSWSSMEHSGRWRLTHSAVQRSFEPVLVSMVQEQGQVRVFLTNDLVESIHSSLKVSLQRFDGKPTSWSQACTMAVQAGTVECPPVDMHEALAATGCSKSTCFFLAQGATTESEARALRAHFFLTPLKEAQLPPARLTVSEVSVDGLRASMKVSTDAVAVYASLESPIVGRFSRNGMLMLPGETVDVAFAAREPIDNMEAFQSTLRVRSLRDTYSEVQLSSYERHSLV
jgi:beta-mannosidase